MLIPADLGYFTENFINPVILNYLPVFINEFQKELPLFLLDATHIPTDSELSHTHSLLPVVVVT